MELLRYEPSENETLQPGLYDMDETVYHADPVPDMSLSASGIKDLLDCPARYWHRRHHPWHKSEFDIGSAAHKLLLGVGPDIAVIGHENWRSKAAQVARDEAREAGKIPVLERDHERVGAMMNAITDHPIAKALLDIPGASEVSAFWEQAGIWRRARFDRLPELNENRRFIVWDYKTTKNAKAEAFARSVASFGYHNSAAWYLDAVKAILGVAEPAFLFVAQEVDPPYLVNVVELDPYALQIGQAQNARAVELFVECRERDRWPGYGEEVEQIALPRWAEIAFEEQEVVV